ncbi:hypothetical protein LCGC14_1573570 [marine sediment metagenome]|uniref:Uncharacterized protein n=1 Tax=marine sediment metagenome TaxID=412755 RepID=A0A0F9L049_9ZZZZ
MINENYLLRRLANAFTRHVGTMVIPDMMRGHIGGLGLSNGTDSEHDIDIAVGTAVDTTAKTVLILPAAMTKRIDAVWAAGTGNGGLFSGSVANNTWYHVHLIEKASGGSIDAGFDTSVTAANIPTGYSKYRRLGSVQTDGSANINGFSQMGDEFLWNILIQDLNTSAPGTSRVTLTLTVPLGIKVRALCNFSYADNVPPAMLDQHLLVTSPGQNDATPATTLMDLIMGDSGDTRTSGWAMAGIRTNTSSQIHYRVNRSNANVFVILTTHGWLDRRGQDD